MCLLYGQIIILVSRISFAMSKDNGQLFSPTINLSNNTGFSSDPQISSNIF
jgi:hypothetical protein